MVEGPKSLRVRVETTKHYCSVADPSARQRDTLTRLGVDARNLPGAMALIAVGSAASGTMDALSDLDLILVTSEFHRTWSVRVGMSAGALWAADDPGSRPDGPGVHKWLTANLVLVELLMGEPGQFRLAEPFQLLWGPAEILAQVPRRPPIDRSRDMKGEPLEVVRAYDELKAAVRRAHS